MYICQFHFRFEPEAKVAVDENGNYVEGYGEIKIKTENQLSDEDFKKAHKELVVNLARLLAIDEKYVIPISSEEYYANVDGGGEHLDLDFE